MLLENQNEQLEAQNSKLTIDLQEEQHRLESLAIRMMETHKYSGSLEDENEDIIDQYNSLIDLMEKLKSENDKLAEEREERQKEMGQLEAEVANLKLQL